MKEIVSTITSKGQLTVPVEVRRKLGLKTGDKVVFQLEGQDVKLAPAGSRLEAGYQSIPALSEPKSWDEVEQALQEDRAEAYARQLQEGNA